MRKTSIGMSVVLAASLLLSSCGGSDGGGGGIPFVALSGPASAPSAPTSGNTATYRVTGALSGLATGQSVTLMGNDQPVGVSQNGAFLAASGLLTGAAYTLTVGTQPPRQTCVVANGTGVIGTSDVRNVSVACSNNQFAYGATQADANVSAYRIDVSTGALTPVAGSPFPAGHGPFSVTVNPANTVAYVANLGEDSVSAYRIDAETGALTPVAGSPFHAAQPAALQSLRIDAQVHLAPLPAVVSTVPVRLPLAFAQHLHAGAVDQQVWAQRCCGAWRWPH